MGKRRFHDPSAWLAVFTAAVLLTPLVVAVPALAESADTDWPQFRGHLRDGISQETGLLAEWPADGPKELWRHPLGEGYSAISVVGDHLFTMYATETDEGHREFAAAFDAKTGKELWRVEMGEKLDTQFGNGPRSTPTVDGDTVFVLGSHGTLKALAKADGKEKWSVSFVDDFGSERPYWGFSTSGVVDGDHLIIEVGAQGGKSYAAFHKATGETAWTSGEARGAGYNSALPVELHGQSQFVYVAGGVLRSIDGAGEELWSHPWPPGETHAMPIFIAPDMIYASGAEGVGATVVKVAKGDAGFSAEEVWKSNLMKNHFSSSVLHEGHLYGFDNATLKCVEAATGEQKWAKRGLGKGSLILADGHLLVLSDRGKLVMVEAKSDAYTQKGSAQALGGRTWTAPTLSNGKLYLRSHDEIVAYDLKG